MYKHEHCTDIMVWAHMAMNGISDRVLCRAADNSGVSGQLQSVVRNNAVYKMYNTPAYPNPAQNISFVVHEINDCTTPPSVHMQVRWVEYAGELEQVYANGRVIIEHFVYTAVISQLMIQPASDTCAALITWTPAQTCILTKLLHAHKSRR
jgi:hypothetical protein